MCALLTSPAVARALDEGPAPRVKALGYRRLAIGRSSNTQFPEGSASACFQLSNVWLAARLPMGIPGAVTQCVRRFRLRGETEKRTSKAALSRIHT
jgi:hypothetical protein